jgi:uncharacterized protein DUF932
MQLAVTHQAERLEHPLPLEALTERVTEAARSDRDYPEVDLRWTRVQLQGTWKFADCRGQFNRHSLGQLCARLVLPNGKRVPASYLACCPDWLLAANLNWQLSDTRQNRPNVLVRVRDEGLGQPCTVRAVLSDRYAVVDHTPVVQTLEKLAPEHGLTVQAWSLDDERLTVRLLIQAEHPASLTDPIRVGVHISNSEVGLGAVACSALITRLVCSNGLIVKIADLGGFSRRHIGRVGEDLARIVQAALPQVLAAAEEAGYRFARLRERSAPSPVDAFIARTARQVEFPQEAIPTVVARLEGESLYDVVNAFALAAQTFPVAERVRVETALSRFLRDGGDTL